MASRIETNAKRKQLVAEIRGFCAENKVSGGMLPPLRDLASRHGLSLAVAQGAVKMLQDEGLVVGAKGIGTSIVTRRFVNDEVFAYFRTGEATMITASEQATFAGFTDRLAELGSFAIWVQDIDRLLAQGAVRCRGISGNLYDALLQQRLVPDVDIPCVGFCEHAELSRDDRVRWDDVSGGRDATFHLLEMGHRRIVFVGEHGDSDSWGYQRAEGYRRAMKEFGLERNAVSVSTEHLSLEDAVVQGEKIAARIATGDAPEAVVAVNDKMAIGLLEGFLSLGLPLIAWPAIIGFDGGFAFRGQAISSMQLDAVEVGRTSADLLWQRAHGNLVGPPQTVSLPMKLIPRMSSQIGWAHRLHQLVEGFPAEISVNPITSYCS